MSYNIDTFKLKKIALTLPKDFSMPNFEKEHRKLSFHDQFEVDGDKWSLNYDGEGLTMSGSVNENGEFIVEALSCYGEFSGNDYEDLLKPLFEEFKGDLNCSTVWEGGDSILVLSIVKGEISESEVEI